MTPVDTQEFSQNFHSHCFQVLCAVIILQKLAKIYRTHECLANKELDLPTERPLLYPDNLSVKTDCSIQVNLEFS